MLLKLFRLWLPLALIIGGLAVIPAMGFTEHSLEIGIPILSAGASVWFFSFLYRVGHAGDHDRDVEQDARDYFAEHGRWPGDGSQGGQR